MPLSLSLTGGNIPWASWKERIQHTQSRDHSSGKLLISSLLILCWGKDQVTYDIIKKKKKKSLSAMSHLDYHNVSICLHEIWWYLNIHIGRVIYLLLQRLNYVNFFCGLNLNQYHIRTNTPVFFFFLSSDLI